MSTTECRLCGSTLEMNEDIERLESLVWYRLESVSDGSFYDPSEYSYPANQPRVKVVAKQITTVEEQGNNDQEIWIVVEYNGKFYKKTGTADSYGERDWNGYIREVQPVEKTVTVYDFK